MQMPNGTRCLTSIASDCSPWHRWWHLYCFFNTQQQNETQSKWFSNECTFDWGMCMFDFFFLAWILTPDGLLKRKAYLNVSSAYLELFRPKFVLFRLWCLSIWWVAHFLVANIWNNIMPYLSEFYPRIAPHFRINPHFLFVGGKILETRIKIDTKFKKL